MLTRTPLSAAAFLVLQRPNRADYREVLKTAAKELVAGGAWRMEIVNRRKRTRENAQLAGRAASPVLSRFRPRRVSAARLVVLIEGDAKPGEAIPLTFVSGLISSVPARNHGGVVGRELSDVARWLERTSDVKGRVLQELEAAGLVSVAERHVLGQRVFRWVRRTPVGDDQVADGGALAGGPGSHEWVDSQLDAAFDGEFEAVFDRIWDDAWGLNGGGGF
jgi:hypothetical protein